MPFHKRCTINERHIIEVVDLEIELELGLEIEVVRSTKV